MMNPKQILAALFAALVLPSQAGSDLTNPLNTYVGSSQTNYPAQPTFLAGSGLECSFIWGGGDGAYEKIKFFDTAAVLPEVPGVKFDFENRGDQGRNYLRTVETDYHTKDFTAYVTVRRPAPIGTNRRAVFFGMGTGARGQYGQPDVASGNAAAYVDLQNGSDNASRRRIGGISGASTNTEDGYQTMTQVSSDAIRIRMQYDSTAATVIFTLDYDYNGTFQEDQILPTSPVSDQVTEWYAGDRASIFFGGDRGVVFTDLAIDAADTIPPPPALTGLQVTAFANQSVTLTWNAGIPGNTYSVYRSLVSGDFGTPPVPIVTGLTTNTYTDNSGLTNEVPYYYVVTQTNPATTLQSAFSNEVSATPTNQALPPQGVVALNAGNNAVLVDWSNLLSPVDTYKVYRSTDFGATFTVLASGLTESRHLDETVTNGNPYIYKVTSVFNSGESADSASVQAIPNPLQVFVDFNGGATNADLGALGAALGTQWNGVGGQTSVTMLNDSLNNPSSLGFSGAGFGTYTDGNGWNVGGNKTAGSKTLVASYDLMLDYGFSWSKKTLMLDGLIPGRKYDLYLYGYGDNLGQNSGFKVGGIAKQTKDPQGLTALTEGRHYVTFTAEASPEGSVSIEMGNPGAVGLTDADAAQGVAILNGFQLVENSSAVPQPINLTANGNTTSVDLEWEAVVGATSYKVYRSTTPASDYTLLPGVMPVIGAYSDTTAVAGTTYYYVVKALVGSVESFYSAEASGVREVTVVDTDSDGLSDADEALIGTDPNDPKDFFVAKTSTVTPSGGNYDISFVINGVQGDYIIERSTTLTEGSWTPVGTPVTWTWTTGVTDNLTLSATGVAPDPGGKEFFRAKGIAPLVP